MMGRAVGSRSGSSSRRCSTLKATSGALASVCILSSGHNTAHPQMGDEAEVEDEPLLVADTRAVWDAIEDGSNRNPAITVQQLIKDDPDHVIQWLAKKGVTKLGEFKVQVRWCWSEGGADQGALFCCVGCGAAAVNRSLSQQSTNKNTSSKSSLCGMWCVCRLH